MTVAAATASTPTGQAGTQPPPTAGEGAGGGGETTTTTGTPSASNGEGGSSASEEGASSTSSFLGDTADSENGEQGSQDDKSKDGQSSTDTKLEIKLPEQLPEGVELDQAMLDSFVELAPKLGLDSAKASEAAKWFIEQMAAKGQAQESAWQEQGKRWAAELKADKEFGGEKLSETVSNARRFMRQFGDGKDGADTVKFIKELGLENHPGFTRLLSRGGAALKEDTAPGAGGGGAAGNSKDAVLWKKYPTLREDGGGNS